MGPILVGLPHPVNALALGATVDDVVNMAAITVADRSSPAVAISESG